MTLHNFFSSKFIDLLRLEGKALIFGLKGFIGKCNYKIQLFWAHKFFILIVIEHSIDKIIRCSENEVEPGVIHSSVQQIHSLQEFLITLGQNGKILSGLWFLLSAFCNILVHWILSWSTPGTISFSDSPNCLIVSVLECSIIIRSHVCIKQILLISGTNF